MRLACYLAALVATINAQSIPKIWVESQVDSWHLPLMKPEVSPSFPRVTHFQRIPVRPIYKCYPVYAPQREPANYWQVLQNTDSQKVWSGGTSPRLDSEQAWIQAGELVYDAPIVYADVWPELRSQTNFAKLGLPTDKLGRVPGLSYVVREKGKVELGLISCGTCHSRVLPNGDIQKGTQGNLPYARLEARQMRVDGPGSVKALRKRLYEYYGAPWHSDDPNARLLEMTVEEIAAVFDSIPPGVYPNHNSSPFFPMRTADLLNLKQRKYLDSTGHGRHRFPSDLMLFSDFHQRGSFYASFGSYHPQTLPRPEDEERYSDEQAYALTQFIYSLQPPLNPNKPNARTEAGQKIFNREGCAGCHTPPLYTNNRLTPAITFTASADHPERARIMPLSVGTDPTTASKTRKGTGLYKVPSLVGLWYRGPFEHNGTIATLEDWFDPARLRDDYVPTGYKRPRVRGVKGHEFGLGLSGAEKTALIAFLRTL